MRPVEREFSNIRSRVDPPSFHESARRGVVRVIPAITKTGEHET